MGSPGHVNDIRAAPWCEGVQGTHSVLEPPPPPGASELPKREVLRHQILPFRKEFKEGFMNKRSYSQQSQTA
jgi:hypothetical protein